MTLLHEDLTEKIIGAFYKVYNTLGYGFLEKVYENALKIELSDLGLQTVAQMPVSVYYKGQVVGQYFADLCVEKAVIVELKAAESLSEAHEVQLLNYLKSTGIEVGLVLDFGKKPEFSRKVFEKRAPR